MAKKSLIGLTTFSRSSRHWGWALLVSLSALLVLGLAVSSKGSILDFRNRAASTCVTVSEGDCSSGCRWVPTTKVVSCGDYSWSNCPAVCTKTRPSTSAQRVCKTVPTQERVLVSCATNHSGDNCDYNPGTQKWTGSFYVTRTVQKQVCTTQQSEGDAGSCTGGTKTVTSGRCTPVPQDCDKNPNILSPVTAGTAQTYDINDPVKAPCEVGHGATVYQLDCKGNKITKSVSGTVRDPMQCFQTKQAHKDADSCTQSGGCWVKSSITSSCIENGAEDSGYKCTNGKLESTKPKLDTISAKDRNDCTYQGGCWVPSHTCIRNGGHYKETGADTNPRDLWCKDALWKTTDPNIKPTPTPTSIPKDICAYLRSIGIQLCSN